MRRPPRPPVPRRPTTKRTTLLHELRRTRTRRDGRGRKLSLGQTRRAWAPILALLAIASACGAPDSQPATGPVANALQTSIASGSLSFDHGPWDELLRDGVVDGDVDYGLFRDRRAELSTYLESLAVAPLAQLSASEAKALLINAYNALTLASIADHPGIASIKDIPGVWNRTRHPVAGHDLTLDEIEHNLLRPFFRDPRIHFVLNCASRSCAPLPTWAFRGDQLDEQLEERSRTFLADPANARLEGHALYLSRYFDWYEDDFTAPDWSPRANSIADFVADYAPPALADGLRTDPAPNIRFQAYDWNLNERRGSR